jgi:hypothetical protein
VYGFRTTPPNAVVEPLHSKQCLDPDNSAPEWQAAMEALILVAENDGPTMLARIGIMRALNRHVERVFNPDAKGIIGGVGS